MISKLCLLIAATLFLVSSYAVEQTYDVTPPSAVPNSPPSVEVPQNAIPQTNYKIPKPNAIPAPDKIPKKDPIPAPNKIPQPNAIPPVNTVVTPG